MRLLLIEDDAKITTFVMKGFRQEGFAVDHAANGMAGLELGLSVVKAVVQAHHGSVEVSSQPGFGSRFTLIFPISAPPAGSAAPPSGSHRSPM